MNDMSLAYELHLWKPQLLTHASIQHASYRFVVNLKIVFVENVMNLCDYHNFVIGVGAKQYNSAA